jgi:hypothetical protein
MGRTQSVDVTVARVPRFAEVVDLVRASGGGFAAYGEIWFMENTEPDSYDWRTTEPAAEESVLAMLAEKADAGIDVGISLVWAATGHGGTLHFRPAAKHVFLLPYADSPEVVPGIIGLGWYLDRLMTDFARFGLVSAEASDVPSSGERPPRQGG